MLPYLLPEPRSATLLDNTQYHLPSQAYISIPSPEALFTAQWIQTSLCGLGLTWQIVVRSERDLPGLHLHYHDDLPDQQYHLRVDERGIHIEGGDAGVFYGTCTLQQLLLQFGRDLPQLAIEDAPDYAVRAVMLDLSGDKVPTLSTLMHLIDDLAALKINQVQLGIEHTFAYIGHEDVWQLASPLTPEDVITLDRHCRQRFITLVPYQNSLGHLERWLTLPRYTPLAETPQGFDPPWGGPRRPPSTLDPQNPNSLTLISDLYDQLLPNFSSAWVNIGCNDAFELGHGKSKEAVKARGGRIYVNWVLKLREELRRRERRVMVWGDVLKRYPRLLADLPKDMLILDWAYEATADVASSYQLWSQAALPFYACAGTSSWNSLIGRTTNAMSALRQAAQAGLEYGAEGYLISDLGENGHLQPLPVSYLGFAYGAALAWGYENNHEIDLPSVLSDYIFRDHAGIMGQLVHDLGNAYLEMAWGNFNGHLLAYIVQVPQRRLEIKEENGLQARLPSEDIHRIMDYLDSLRPILSQTDMRRPDADLILREYQQAIRLIQHAARWLLIIRKESAVSARSLSVDLAHLIAEQRDLWLARNRRGGLEDSIERLASMRDDYRAIIAGTL